MESDDLVEISLDTQKKDAKKQIKERTKEHTVGKAFLGILKRFRILLIIIILAAVGLVIFNQYRQKQAVAAAMMQTAQTETAKVEKRNLTSGITATGTVKSMESRVIKSALTKTELSEVDVEVGDTVEAGQVVAIFKDEDIRTDIARVQDKINTSEQKEAIETQATDREYVYTYGTEALSITSAQQKVDDALKALYEACDGYGSAKRKLQELKDNNAKDTEITQQEAAVSSAYQTEVKAQQTYQDALQAQAEALRSANNTLATTDENYQKSALTKGDSTEELEQQLEDLQTSLNNCVVTAPIGGVITSLAVKSGDTYIEGELMTIQNCDMFTVSAQIDEYDISDLKEGMQVVIKTDATRDDELDGVVSFISPTATAATGSSTDATYEVTIDILTQDDRLKLGMTAKLNIIVDEVENVLTVPYDAISTNAAGESVVYVVDGDIPNLDDMPAEAKEADTAGNLEAGATIVISETTTPIINVGEGDSNAAPPNGMPDGTTPDNVDTKSGSKKKDFTPPTLNQKEVVVEIGMESDYYTQVISDELSEGMTVIIPSAVEEGGTDQSNVMINMGGPGGGGMP